MNLLHLEPSEITVLQSYADDEWMTQFLKIYHIKDFKFDILEKNQ